MQGYIPDLSIQLLKRSFFLGTPAYAVYLFAIFVDQQNNNGRKTPNARNSRLKLMLEAVLG
jgi:hypothetical protein